MAADIKIDRNKKYDRQLRQVIKDNVMKSSFADSSGYVQIYPVILYV